MIKAKTISIYFVLYTCIKKTVNMNIFYIKYIQLSHSNMILMSDTADKRLQSEHLTGVVYFDGGVWLGVGHVDHLCAHLLCQDLVEEERTTGY